MAKQKPQTEQKTTIRDWTEADAVLAEIAKVDQSLKKAEGEMNLKINDIQSKFQPSIDEFNAEKLKLERNLQLFCEERRDEFDKQKTKELSYGLVAFRLSTGALKTLKKWTWGSVEAFIGKSKKYQQYLIVKTSIDKNGLKADLDEKELAKIGCYIEQQEAFYYECFERK